MSQKQQRDPLSRRQAEQIITISQRYFNGQLRGVPLSNIGRGNTFRSINADNHNEWSAGRPGTRTYTESMPASTIHAQMDHIKSQVLVWLIGTTVYVSDKAMSTFTEVLNISGITITEADAWIEPDDENAILSTTSGIFRIILDESPNYYMYQVNISAPTVMLVESSETDSNVFGYNYMYGLARITGSGNRNRVTPNVILQLESGTASDGEQYYSQVFFDEEAGDDNHVITVLTMPSGVQGMTHYTMYRTLNIGENTELGKINDPAYFVWVEDVPVIKPIIYKIVTNVASSQVGTFEKMDAGSDILLIDGSTHSIVDVLLPGTDAEIIEANGIYYGAIGASSVFKASQAGNTITRVSGTRNFTAADVGKIFFWAESGEYSLVQAYVDANTLTTLEFDNHGEQVGAMDPTTRNFNDYVKDDARGAQEIGLKERMNAEPGFLYVPLEGFDPLPNADVCLQAEEYFVTALRDSMRFYYSSIGARRYALGQYKPDVQLGVTKRPIRHIVSFPSLAVFLLVDATYSVALNVSTERGNTNYGESIPQLNSLGEVDDGIGVQHWATAARVNANRMIVLTNEPAIRMLNGHKWLEENLAVTSSGKMAVQPYLEAMDTTYDAIATYNIKTGYILWIFKWTDADSPEVDSDNIIIDTLGSSVAPADIYEDTLGSSVASDDKITDTLGEQ